MTLPAHIANKSNLISPNILQPGDLVLVRDAKPGALQKAINNHQKKFTSEEDAQWTHAALLRQEYKILEMTSKGIESEHYLWKYQSDQYHIRIRRIRNLSHTGGQKIVEAALENGLIIRDYDWFSLLILSLAKSSQKLRYLSPPTIKKSICSALYARAASAVGHDLGEGLDYRLVTPAHLSCSPFMEDVKLSTISGDEFRKWWSAERTDGWTNNK